MCKSQKQDFQYFQVKQLKVHAQRSVQDKALVALVHALVALFQVFVFLVQVVVGSELGWLELFGMCLKEG